MLLQLPFGSDFVEIAAQLANIIGALVLLLLLVAFGAFVYKSVQGDGIQWPSDVKEDAEDDSGVSRGSEDDDWKYY